MLVYQRVFQLNIWESYYQNEFISIFQFPWKIGILIGNIHHMALTRTDSARPLFASVYHHLPLFTYVNHHQWLIHIIYYN